MINRNIQCYSAALRCMELSAGDSVNTILDIVKKYGWKTGRLERGWEKIF